MAQQLTRIGEPPHIANLDHECSGADQPDPTQHLQMLRHRANGQSIRLSSMAFSSRRTRSRPCVSARISSCRTAAPRKRETDLLQPAQIFGASGRQARINLAVSQQERSYLLRFAGAASYGGLTGADQATYGFVGVRCPDQSTRLPETGAPASPHPGGSSWYGHRHGDGNSMPVFGHIQSDENFAILSHGLASWLEDRRLAQPAYPYGQCRAGHLIGRHRKGMRLTNGV